jgi:prepilin-type N-terminal cleavage/methylation domain-containing protein
MKKAYLHINNRGFSLVEILVAVSVFLVFVLATTGVITSIYKDARHSANGERAAILTEEAIEATRNLRDASPAFASLPDGTYGLSTTSNQWNLSGSSDTEGIFTRFVTISTINGSQKRVTATASWTDQTSAGNSVTASTYLTDWRAPLSIGLTINKSVINHGGTKVPSDFLPTDLTTLAWDYSVDPPVQNSIDIPILFSPSTMTLGPGIYTFVTTIDPNYSLALSTDCGGGSIVLADGDAKLCNITYEQYYVPAVTTPASSSIATSTATLGATVTSLGNPATLTARGVCFNTAGSPTLTNGATCVTATLAQTLTAYNVGITGLTPNTTYKFAGYATNSFGTGYSVDGTFTTLSGAVVPTVTTPTSASITGNTATLGATLTSLGIPATLTARGVCFNTAGSPTLTNGATCVTATLAQTLTAYTTAVTGLIPGTVYKYAGYATNSSGTGYSADGTFTTLGNPGGACTVTGITPTTKDQSSGATNVVTKPTGVVQNDLLFAYIGHENATDVLNSLPSGWTQVGRVHNGSANVALYYKLAGASEPASYTFGFSSSVRSGVTLNVYRGCFNLSSPVEVISNTPQYTVGNTTYRAASMNLLSTYSNIILFPSVVVSGSKSFAAPLTQGGGWSTQYNQGNSSSRFSRSAFSKVMITSGATGVMDSIGTYSGTTEKNAFAVGLKPL